MVLCHKFISIKCVFRCFFQFTFKDPSSRPGKWMISVFWIPGTLQLLPCGFQNKVSDWQLHVLGVLYEQLSISLATFKMISIVEHIPTKEPMITQL